MNGKYCEICKCAECGNIKCAKRCTPFNTNSNCKRSTIACVMFKHMREVKV